MNKYSRLFAEGGLSLERLRTLCLMDDEGSLTAAAGGDPNALSSYWQQIRQLERVFGGKLTAKQGKVLKLTSDGRRLAALARGYLNELETFLLQSQAKPTDVRIGASNSIAAWLLMPRIDRVRKALAGATVTVWTMRTDETVDRLERNELQYGIVRGDAVPPGYAAEQVMAIRYALFVPSAMCKGWKKADLQRRLKNVPLATSMGGRFRKDLERMANEAGWSLTIAASCSSFLHAAQALASGTMGAVLPALAPPEALPGSPTAFALPFLRGYAQAMKLVCKREDAELNRLAKALR